MPLAPFPTATNSPLVAMPWEKREQRPLLLRQKSIESRGAGGRRSPARQSPAPAVKPHERPVLVGHWGVFGRVDRRKSTRGGFQVSIELRTRGGLLLTQKTGMECFWKTPFQEGERGRPNYLMEREWKEVYPSPGASWLIAQRPQVALAFNTHPAGQSPTEHTRLQHSSGRHVAPVRRRNKRRNRCPSPAYDLYTPGPRGGIWSLSEWIMGTPNLHKHSFVSPGR